MRSCSQKLLPQGCDMQIMNHIVGSNNQATSAPSEDTCFVPSDIVLRSVSMPSIVSMRAAARSRAVASRGPASAFGGAACCTVLDTRRLHTRQSKLFDQAQRRRPYPAACRRHCIRIGP